ncbi:thrombospondin type 3 repeat-containing protein [Candidatus Aciduliprofundum boonei]|uniref:Transglutaminase-like domain-containing protein n=1 Tax=Aciduliprofundum boonei (strain DSM 19572 / T469) TaxID=439481 RepID=B5IER8_ACIB4|nr:hypothetical protein [Candidatus Aciduliprofundum boonei]ADD07944.1 hypothetical protein Aboo_0132 [Aciduliprofundum boonei T469]EDY35222.1 hypothetical protein ABOONEI_293 [Aciduliprofundum boonei T469]HII55596.1 hypothetical protein [Candidatus Aciduliprofundum boonei]
MSSELLSVIQDARRRVLEDMSFVERVKAFFAPEILGEEVAQELKNMGLEEFVREQYRSVEREEYERIRAKAEYEFWRDFEMEKIKNDIAKYLSSAVLTNKRLLGFFPIYDFVPSIDDIFDMLVEEHGDDVERALREMEKNVSGENKKKVQVAKKKVRRRSKGRRRKIIYALLSAGLMIGAAVGMYYYEKYVKDSDHDGIPDWFEIHKYHTNPNKADTDGDGLTDYQEIFQYHTNPLVKDTDHDGINDGLEVQLHMNPLKPTLFNETGIQEVFSDQMVKDIKAIGTIWIPSFGFKSAYWANSTVTVSYGNGYKYTLPIKDSLTGARLIPTFIWNAGRYKNSYYDPRFSPYSTLLYLNDMTHNLGNNITKLNHDSKKFSSELQTLENSLINITKNPNDNQSFERANKILMKYKPQQNEDMWYDEYWFFEPINNKFRNYLREFNNNSTDRINDLEKALFILNGDKQIASTISNTTPYVSLMLDFMNEYKKIVKKMPHSEENVKINWWTNEGMHLWSIESAMGMVTMNILDYPETLIEALFMMNGQIFNNSKQNAKISSDLTPLNLPAPVEKYWTNFYDNLSSLEKSNFKNWLRSYTNNRNSTGILDYLLIRDWVYKLLPTKNVYSTSNPKIVDYGFRLTTTGIFDIDDKEDINFIRGLWKKVPNEAPSIDKVWNYTNEAGVALPRVGNIVFGPFTVEKAQKLGKNDCATATAAMIEILMKYYPKYLPVAVIKTFPIITEKYKAIGIHNMPFFYHDGNWYEMELWNGYNKPTTEIEDHLASNIDGWVTIPIAFGNAPVSVPLRDDRLLNIVKEYVPDKIVSMMYYLRQNNIHDE